MVGDPHYMAPEQISGTGYGFGVDYWALGILLYVMLHMANPFGSDASSETEVRFSSGSMCMGTPERLNFTPVPIFSTRVNHNGCDTANTSNLVVPPWHDHECGSRK